MKMQLKHKIKSLLYLAQHLASMVTFHFVRTSALTSALPLLLFAAWMSIMSLSLSSCGRQQGQGYSSTLQNGKFLTPALDADNSNTSSDLYVSTDEDTLLDQSEIPSDEELENLVHQHQATGGRAQDGRAYIPSGDDSSLDYLREWEKREKQHQQSSQGQNKNQKAKQYDFFQPDLFDKILKKEKISQKTNVSGSANTEESISHEQGLSDERFTTLDIDNVDDIDGIDEIGENNKNNFQHAGMAPSQSSNAVILRAEETRIDKDGKIIDNGDSPDKIKVKMAVQVPSPNSGSSSEKTSKPESTQQKNIIQKLEFIVQPKQQKFTQVSSTNNSSFRLDGICVDVGCQNMLLKLNAVPSTSSSTVVSTHPNPPTSASPLQKSSPTTPVPTVSTINIRNPLAYAAILPPQVGAEQITEGPLRGLYKTYEKASPIRFKSFDVVKGSAGFSASLSLNQNLSISHSAHDLLKFPSIENNPELKKNLTDIISKNSSLFKLVEIHVQGPLTDVKDADQKIEVRCVFQQDLSTSSSSKQKARAEQRLVVPVPCLSASAFMIKNGSLFLHLKAYKYSDSAESKTDDENDDDDDDDDASETKESRHPLNWINLAIISSSDSKFFQKFREVNFSINKLIQSEGQNTKTNGSYTGPEQHRRQDIILPTSNAPFALPSNPQNLVTKIIDQDINNELIKKRIKDILNDERTKGPKLGKFLTGIHPNIGNLKPIFEAHDVPFEFLTLTLIESDFFWSEDYPVRVNNATRRATDTGPWQFTSDTAREYLLKIFKFNFYKGKKIAHSCDERGYLLNSTKAATKYLRTLLDEFPSDPRYAILSYNWGKGNVYQAVPPLLDKRIRNRLNKIRYARMGYWFAHERNMIKSIRHRYVVDYIASQFILRNPEKFNLKIIPHQSPPGIAPTLPASCHSSSR